MLKTINRVKRGLIVASILFIMVITNYYFNIGSFLVPNFYMVIGFSIGMHIVFDKEILPYIFIGVLIPNIIGRLVYIDESLIANISYSLALSFINIVAIHTVYHIVNLLKVEMIFNLKNTTIFVVIVLIDCFLITSLTTTLILI